MNGTSRNEKLDDPTMRYFRKRCVSKSIFPWDAPVKEEWEDETVYQLARTE